LPQLLNSRRSRPKPYVLTDFGGLDPGGETGFAALRNFRIVGGHLKKRCGSRLLDTYPGDIRGLWYGDIDGEVTLFCVSGNTLYRGTGSERTALAQLGTASGRVCIFYYHGRLYILDGDEFYCWDGSSLTVVEGYVPIMLIGAAGYEAAPYYDRNRLNNRVIYRLTDMTSGRDYALEGNIAEVEKAIWRGAETPFTVTGSGTSTTVKFPSAYGTVDLYVRLADEGYRKELVSQLYTLAYSSLADDTVFLYGGPSPSSVFHNGRVDGEPRIDYFPLSNVINAANGQRPVTSLIRQYDSIMLFTSGETYMMNPKVTENELGYVSVDYPLYTLNPGIGCPGWQNARQADELPVSVGRDGIYRWVETDKQGERTAQLISEGIDPLLTRNMLTSSVTHVCRRYGEFWLYDGDVILVYNTDSGKWYIFDGITADGFIETEETCYYKGPALYIFDEELYTDDGQNYSAYAETGYLDFGYPHLNKRLFHIFVTFDACGYPHNICSACVRLEADNLSSVSVFGLTSDKYVPKTVRLAGTIMRFCFLRLMIEDSSSAPLSISGVSMQYGLLGEAKSRI